MKKLLIPLLFISSANAIEVSYGMGEHSFNNEKEKRTISRI